MIFHVMEGLMIMHLFHSKTDQLWKGDEVAIMQISNITCTVTMLEAYIHVAARQEKQKTKEYQVSVGL